MRAMNPLAANQNSRLWNALIWVLRITVALECLGTWSWFVQWVENSFLHWLLNPTDVGGLHWNESTAMAVQWAVGWLMLLAGLFVLVRPCASVLGPVALVQLLIAVAMWRSDDGFTLESSWLSPQTTALFPFFTHLARIAAPLGLLLLDPWRVERHLGRPLGHRRVTLAIVVLRWAAAITFFAHGIEAWLLHPEFVDLLISSSQNILGVVMPQSLAERLLKIIGGMDFLIAIACISTRWRVVLWWMAFWGGVTAVSRVAAYGVDVGWSSALMRAPHVGIPVAVVFYWHLLEWARAKSAAKPTIAADDIQMREG
jgi:hypothetical protein